MYEGNYIRLLNNKSQILFILIILLMISISYY